MGLTEKFEVAFPSLELVEAYICLNSNTRARVAQVGITARNDSKSFAPWLP